MNNIKIYLRLVLLSGIISVLIGLLINPNTEITLVGLRGVDIKGVFVAIGTSTLAAWLVTKINYYFSVKPGSVDELWFVWRIKNVFEKRSDITQECKIKIPYAESIDIIAITMRSLIELHGDEIKRRLIDNKLKLRIILPYPPTNITDDIENYLELSIGDIYNSVNKAELFIKDILKHNAHANIELRYLSYNIWYMYQRIDSLIYWGPYLKGIESQNTFTIQFEKDGLIGEKLEHNFNCLFDSAKIKYPRDVKIIEFMGMPGAGKTTISNEILGTDNSIDYFSNELVESLETDEPFDFNERLSKYLFDKIYNLNDGDTLILDRGINDYKVWLNVHEELGNISKKNVNYLLSKLPYISKGIDYRCIVFVQPPEITIKRRVIERRVDEWALKKETLIKLQNHYKEYAQQNKLQLVNSSIDLKKLRPAVHKLLNENHG